MIPRPIVLYCTRFLVFFFILGFFYTVLKNVAFYRRQSESSALIFVTNLDPVYFQSMVPDRWKDKIHWEMLQPPSLMNIFNELTREINNIDYFEEREAAVIKVKVPHKIIASEPEIFDILVLKFQEVQQPFSFRILGDESIYQWLSKWLLILYGFIILLALLILWELVEFTGYLHSVRLPFSSAGIMIFVLLFSGLFWALLNATLYIYLGPAPFYWSIMNVFEQAVAVVFFIILGLFILRVRKINISSEKEINL